MATKTIDCPPAVIKYTMYSLIPGMGSIRGHYARLGAKQRTTKRFGVDYTYTEMTAHPLTRKEALAFISNKGLTQEIRNEDTVLYIQPGEHFRWWCRSCFIKIPDRLGENIIDNKYFDVK